MATDAREPDTVVSSMFFVLEIDGVAQGAFSNLTISSEVEPTEAEPNGVEPQARRMRQRVTLQRRMNDDLQLFAWHQAVLDGPVEAARKDCTVRVFDPSGLPVGRYRLDRAWPFKLKIGPLEAGREEILIEAVTFICDHVRRVSL